MRPGPATGAEYRQHIQDAVLEMQDLQRCAEDDIDDELSDLVPAFKGIERALYDLLHGNGEVIPAGRDLPFMALARTYRHVIPVFSMLDAINRAHREGMTVTD